LDSLFVGTSQFNLNFGDLKGESFCDHPNAEINIETVSSTLKIMGNHSFKV
jgi:hypothetical protein